MCRKRQSRVRFKVPLTVFATVRHRTVRTKGALSAKTAKLMVLKLVNAAAKTWRRLKGENQLPKVVQGVKFKNGVEVTECPLTTPPDQPRHPKSCLAPFAVGSGGFKAAAENVGCDGARLPLPQIGRQAAPAWTCLERLQPHQSLNPM